MSVSRRAHRPHGSKRTELGREWIELRVVTSRPAAEAVGAMLWDLAVAGVAEDQPTPGVVRLR